MIKTISLFSGSGGLDLGFIQTNKFDIIQANDINPHACATYKQNIAEHIINCDIREFNPDVSADLIIGGPPCQGFSLANPNRALDDPRNWLFKEYVRVINMVSPKMFLMENVSGLVTLEKGKIFSIIKGEFEKCGYRVYDRVLNAVNFEVPQNRNRLILIGVRNDIEGVYSFPEPLVNPPIWGKYLTVRDSILNVKFPANDPNNVASNLTTLNLERVKHIPQGGSMKDCPAKLQNKSDLNRAMRRLHADKPSYTIVHNNCDHYYHPLENRRITIREMALLQTYPMNYLFSGSKSEQSRQVGNSVPVRLAFHLANSIFEFLSKIQWEQTKKSKRTKSNLPIAP